MSLRILGHPQADIVLLISHCTPRSSIGVRVIRPPWPSQCHSAIVRTIRESGQLTIRVTTETASEGRSSARFTDEAHDKPFLPYLFLQPTFLHHGTIHFSTDFRLTCGAEPSLEFRTVENRREYPVSPALRFAGDGRLRIEQGRELMAVPHDQWFRVEIRWWSCTICVGRSNCSSRNGSRKSLGEAAEMVAITTHARFVCADSSGN